MEANIPGNSKDNLVVNHSTETKPLSRVTLNCMRTRHIYRMPLELNGSLSIDRIKEFVVDAIGIRYK